MIWYWIFLILGLLSANVAGMAMFELQEDFPLMAFILTVIFNFTAIHLVGVAYKVKLNKVAEKLNNKTPNE